MSIINTIHQGRHAFEAKTGRPPTELYLGQESYACLIASLRDVVPPRWQHDYSGLKKFDGMWTHVVMHERSYVGFEL